MATRRKKHAHPLLIPPRTIWRRWVDRGTAYKEKIGYEENDQEKIIGGRQYIFHPTKGWRNFKINPTS